MDDVKINTSKTLTLTLPSDPTSNTVSTSLYHEFGSLVSGPTNATRTGTGVYTITYGQQASGIYILNSDGYFLAKESALIAVDEIIKNNLEYFRDAGLHNDVALNIDLSYWQEVKKEIEKI